MYNNKWRSRQVNNTNKRKSVFIQIYFSIENFRLGKTLAPNRQRGSRFKLCVRWFIAINFLQVFKMFISILIKTDDQFNLWYYSNFNFLLLRFKSNNHIGAQLIRSKNYLKFITKILIIKHQDLLRPNKSTFSFTYVIFFYLS